MFKPHTIIPTNLNKLVCKSCRHFTRQSFNRWFFERHFLWWESVFGTKCVKLFSAIFVKKAGSIRQIHENIGVDSFQCDLDVRLFGTLTPLKERIVYSWNSAIFSSRPRNNQRFFALFQFLFFPFCKIGIHSFWNIAVSPFPFYRKIYSQLYPYPSVIERDLK